MTVRSGIARDPSTPDCFRPQTAESMFPAVKGTDLSRLKQAGWARLGIVAAVVDPASNILMLKHRPSDKISDTACWGPLAETTHVIQANGRVIAEDTAQTLARSLAEELEVAKPELLGLTARRIGAWALNAWPVGVSYQGQEAFAVCPVVHVSRDGKGFLMDTFDGSEEIADIEFWAPDDIIDANNTRNGTRQWLVDINRSGLITPARAGEGLVPVTLPSPIMAPGAVDVKFAEIGYL